MKPSDVLYCVDCEELFPLEGHRDCPSCGSTSWLPLQRVMKTEAEPYNPLPPIMRWPSWRDVELEAQGRHPQRPSQEEQRRFALERMQG